jgi:hypothetical protein
MIVAEKEKAATGAQRLFGFFYVCYIPLQIQGFIELRTSETVVVA